MTEQKITFKKPLTINIMSLGSSIFKKCPVYKGIKYDDTCITDIYFYYKGSRIPVRNIRKYKKKYVANIHNNLKKIFTNSFLRYGDDYKGRAKSYSNGKLVFGHDDEDLMDKPVASFMPTHWRVKNSKLYLKYKGKWELFNHDILTSPESPEDISVLIYYKDKKKYKPWFKLTYIRPLNKKEGGK